MIEKLKRDEFQYLFNIALNNIRRLKLGVYFFSVLSHISGYFIFD